MDPLRSDTSRSSSLKSTSPPPSPPPLHLPHTSATPPPEPQDFHLKPCTWDTLTTLPSEQRYEVVDGILILQPTMPNGTRIHQKIIANLPTLLSRLLSHCIVSAGVDVETSAVDSGPSSSSTRPHRRSSRITNDDKDRQVDRTQRHQDEDDTALNVRVPDVMIKPANTDSSSSPPHKSRKHVGFKLGECIVVIEVTSPDTRKVDMEVKWKQYFLSGIDIYIIIDIAPVADQGGTPTVIVGSLMEYDASLRAPNGYPGIYHRRGQSGQSSYYKREYNDGESIALHGLADIRWPSDVITPKLLGDPKAIERLSEKTRQDKEQKFEAERQGHLHERQGRLDMEQKYKEERQGRLEERQGRREERQGRPEEKQGRLEEKQGRLEERQGRLEEKQGRLEERQGRLKAEKRITAMEEEIRRLRREQGSSSSSGTGVAEERGARSVPKTRRQKRKQQQR